MTLIQAHVLLWDPCKMLPMLRQSKFQLYLGKDIPPLLHAAPPMCRMLRRQFLHPSFHPLMFLGFPTCLLTPGSPNRFVKHNQTVLQPLVERLSVALGVAQPDVVHTLDCSYTHLCHGHPIPAGITPELLQNVTDQVLGLTVAFAVVVILLLLIRCWYLALAADACYPLPYLNPSPLSAASAAAAAMRPCVTVRRVGPCTTY